MRTLMKRLSVGGIISLLSLSATADHHSGSVDLPKRLAFMSGHVEAGLALYRAGAPEMAAAHLLHPVSESHADERQGLAALGFEQQLFERVSASLDLGIAAAQIEKQLAAAEENLALVAERAGGDPAAIIRYLMSTVKEEYAIGVTDGRVSDPGEYQDAFGFTVVALDRSRALPSDVRGAVIDALNQLLSLWPEAPVPPAQPTAVDHVTHAANAVLRALE